MTWPVPETDAEKAAVTMLLGIMRAGYDNQEIKTDYNLVPAYRWWEAYSFGVRDMGATFTLRAWSDRPRDPQPGERLEEQRRSWLQDMGGKLFRYFEQLPAGLETCKGCGRERDACPVQIWLEQSAAYLRGDLDELPPCPPHDSRGYCT